MSRRLKWISGGAAGLAALILGIVLIAVYIAQSNWLRENVRERIITEVEKATGGRVEISKFLFDWTTLTAEVDGLVIHGTEPAGSPPLLTIDKFVMGLKVISLIHQDVDVANVRVETPRLYLLVAADGSTNVPAPKAPRKNGADPIQTILDLKIGEFTLLHGTTEVLASGQQPKLEAYDAAGRNLETKFSYDTPGQKYAGSLAVKPLHVQYGSTRPSDADVRISLAIGKNRLEFSDAKIDTADSHLQLSGVIASFTNPVVTAQFNGTASLQELGSILKLKSRQSGTVELQGKGRYASPADYEVDAEAHGRKISFAQGRQGVKGVGVDATVHARPEAIELDGLHVLALGGRMDGRAELRGIDNFLVSGEVRHFDIGVLAAFATPETLPYDGAIDGHLSAKGRLSDTKNQHLEISANVAISPAGNGVPVHGSVDATYSGVSGQVALGASYVTLPHTRLDASGVLGGVLRVQAESTNLDDLLPVAGQKIWPIALRQGSLQFDGTVAGKLDSPRIDGRVTGRDFIYADQLIDSLSAEVGASENGASVRSGALAYKGLRAKFQGSLGLKNWKPVDASALNASATLQNASVADLLVLAGRKDVPVSGTLNATAQFAGTLGDPQASATLRLANGSLYQEPFDSLMGAVEFVNGGTQVGNFQLKAGAKQLDISARYQHAPQEFETGQLHFQVASNRVALAQMELVKRYQPGLSGSAAINATGDASLIKGVAKIESLNGNASAMGLALNSRQLGDVKVTARTEARQLKTHFTSNLAGADIQGDGAWQLGGDYPGSAQVKIAKFDLSTARKMLAPKGGESFGFSGSAEGKLSVSGPLMKPQQLTATLEVPQVEIRPEPGAALNRELADLTIRNTQPIRVSLVNSVVRVESARFTAVNTDVSLVGTVNLKQKDALNLNLNGNLNLNLARTFSSDIDSSGSLLVRVTLRGPLANPQLGGTADLRSGNISVAGVPNGLSNANGRISFDENRANIESMTAQTGGGTIKLSGFTAFGGPFVSFRLGAVAAGVRVRYPQGVSSVSDANLSWTGTTERSVLSGEVTVHKVSYNQQADLSSVLSLTNGPAPTSSAPTGVLGGTQFDVRVQTASDISFQTGLLTGLQTEANLRLRGTAANPALLGRIVINSGTLTFFGNKYTINEGTVSFFNPVKIEPVLNVDLETQARGVDVTLTVAGPLNKLSVTYRSDPPLQFSDIVALLATGKTPSDPTLAARQTDTQQSWQELGATALVGQAIANPVSGRLQRFFGVSKLKIDPLLPGLGGAGSGGSNPGARVSVEQQVTPNVVFDYVISTNSTSSQIVRVEWAFSKHWSAVILREENSAFGIDFQYKKRFK